MSQSTGPPLIEIAPEILAGIGQQAAEVTRSAGGALAWPGLKRKLDRVNPG